VIAMTVPTCPNCNKPMTFIYKDVGKHKLVYKCRTCGYREEEFEKEIIDG